MPHPYRPLSRARDLIQPHYDVLVVGSGYGAAVAASRFARAGRPQGKLRVAVFERGREWPVGTFPDAPLAAQQELQLDAPGGRIGNPTGLYDLRLNDEQAVLVGCGLGGTSLINANVSLAADPRVFEDPAWPQTLRGQAAALAPCYARVDAMLRPRPLPADFPHPAKLKALEAMAAATGSRCVRPPINVNFEFDGPNHVGIHQPPCVGCGDCVSGCNTGAKNTLAMNYLPDAAAFGAEIFCEVQVRRLERDPHSGRWRVYYQLLANQREAFDAPELCVNADLVVLGAGSLGSTEILLRSREQGLALSGQLGRRFTGNGDVLAFGYNLDRPVNGVGRAPAQTGRTDPTGPCITGLIDRRTGALEQGYVIEDGSLPSALAAALPAAFSVAAAAGLGQVPADGWPHRLGRWWRGLRGGPYAGAMHHTQTYLVMSHDDAQGRLTLERDRVRVIWPGVARQGMFARVNEALAQATFALHGIFVKNPLWHRWFDAGIVAWAERVLLGTRSGARLITVHPLGGCGMGDSGAAGVVNGDGQVFRDDSTAVHDGLYVVDGAIMPRSLGVNPLYTIAALAERIVDRAAALRGWSIDYDAATPAPAPTRPRTLGLRFTETMRGYFSTQVKHADPDGFQRGWTEGKAHASPMTFTLTVASDDLDRMLADPRHATGLAGTVTAPALSPDPLTVSEGRFELLTGDASAVETRRMRYRMRLERQDGPPLYFSGDKVIRDEPALDPWQDTTTLFVTVHDGDSEAAPILGVGILRILPEDLMRQLATLAVPGARNWAEQVEALARFGHFFAGTLVDQYGGVFTHYPFGRAEPASRPRSARALRSGTPQVHGVTTADGVSLRLTRYRGGDKGPVLLSHGLGVASTLFSLDTIDTNLLEYLYEAGYDVWLLDYRASILLPACRSQFTGDHIARYDYPAAVDKVRALTGRDRIDIVAHCFGASTLFMALANGLEGVRSALFSQVAGHVVAPAATRLKAGLYLPDLLDALQVPTLTAAVAAHPGPLTRLYDLALSHNLAIPGEEQCTSAVCHRISFMYALLYEHAQLNQATHDALGELFGEANISAFEHLARTVRAGKVVAADGEDCYLPDDVAIARTRLARLNMPIRFIHGAQNACFLPESTERTQALLTTLYGSARYSRVVIPGYGHIDCIFGKHAAVDVYPHILDHLEQAGAT
ncbi:GMC oxidoreductase [Chitiniphilus purpureus]|uniref:Cholesterol oxidase n=1 Tax=Chitiniphilus purpureus TaxID=2981137 RepID=A0ABY6DPU4_9NEIS|nr:GMC oxidoreductase [Chitiniphilus sp. CD1]UXY16357.1 GMC oxidoreductase [Chitiniphilus sp. CD1]